MGMAKGLLPFSLLRFDIHNFRWVFNPVVFRNSKDNQLLLWYSSQQFFFDNRFRVFGCPETVFYFSGILKRALGYTIPNTVNNYVPMDSNITALYTS